MYFYFLVAAALLLVIMGEAVALFLFAGIFLGSISFIFLALNYVMEEWEKTHE